MASSYTFQSSGTVVGNVYNSVVMAPSPNGSILLQQKQDNATVQTRFLKVTSLVLSANTETRTLSWTDVGAASQDLNVFNGDTLIGTQTIDDTSYVVPSESPFVDLSFTVSCVVNGETLPNSNRITIPAATPSIVFQTTQSFQTNEQTAPINPSTYTIENLLTYVNGLFTSSVFSFDGTQVTFTPNGQSLPPNLTTAVFLEHLGFDMQNSQVSFGVSLTEPIQASNPIALIQGNTPQAPSQPTDLAFSDITTTTATLTVNVPQFEDLLNVAVVQLVDGNQVSFAGGIQNPDNNSVTIPLTGLTADTEQTLAVVSSTRQDLSPISESVTFTTLTEEVSPPVPTQLGFIPTPVRTPRLEWTQSGGNVDSFDVNVQEQGILTHTYSTGRGFPFYHDFSADQLTMGSTQSVSVGLGKIESNQLEITIPTTVTVPTVSVDSVTTNSMVIVCTDTNDNSGLGETTFDISIDPGNQDGVIGFTNVASPYTLTGLSPNTQQTLSATARFVSGGARITESSNTITATTSSIPPPVIATDLVFTSTPIRTPKLEWSQSGEQLDSFTVNVQNDSGTLLQAFNTSQGFPFFNFPADELQVGVSYLLSVVVPTGESEQLPVTIPNTFSLPIVSVDSVTTDSLNLVFTDTNDGSGNGNTQFDLTIFPANQNEDTVFSDLTSPYTLTNLVPETAQTLSVVAKFTSGGPQTTSSSNSVTGTTSLPPPLISDTWTFNDAQGIIPAGECTLVPNLPTLEDLYIFNGSYLSSSNTTQNGDLFANDSLVGKQVTLTNGSSYSQKYLVTNSSTSESDFLIGFQQNSGGNATLRSSLIGTQVTLEVTDS